MIFLVFTLGLWALVLLAAQRAWARRDGTLGHGIRLALGEFRTLLPRLAVGVIGAGFLARLLPGEAVQAWLGQGSGLTGIAIASLAGALTPGGPVVGFSLGSAALKAGAGLPQIVAFVTAWSLYTLQRMLVWELPIMPQRFVVTRVLVSLPLPLIAAGLAALVASF